MKVNDSCWCHSGKKYKNCHRDREREKPTPPGQLRALVQKAFLENKTCFHPEAPAGCGKVIHAHSLQRSGIIKRLSGSDNHVRSFYPMEIDGAGALKRHPVGLRKASAFYGFCESHDAPLFSAIENEPFSGSTKQVLLVGYRALCHELYQKQAAIDAEPILAEHLDRGRPEIEQRAIQRDLAVQSSSRRVGLEELKAIKQTYDQMLLSEDYSVLSRAVFWFRDNLFVVGTGTVYVDFDLANNRLQNVARDPSPIHGFTYGVVAMPEGCAFVATWPIEFWKCDQFFRSLNDQPAELVASVLIEFFFAYVENTYFSEAWWLSLPSQNAKRLSELAGNPNQYGSPLNYSGMKHVELELIRHEFGQSLSTI